MILGNGRPSFYTAHEPPPPASFREPPARKSLTQQLDRWIEAHPAISVAAALTVGVTLGWLIKRR
jgi:hypothetical protein